MTILIFENSPRHIFIVKREGTECSQKLDKNKTLVFKKGNGPGPSVERVLLEFGAERKLMKMTVFESFQAGSGMALNDFWYLAQ